MLKISANLISLDHSDCTKMPEDHTDKVTKATIF